MYNELLNVLINCGCFSEDDIYRKYSGRGMFGKQCLGVIVDNSHSALVSICQYIVEHYSRDCDSQKLVAIVYDLFEALKDTCTDNMARQIIMYWPDVLFEEDEDNE